MTRTYQRRADRHRVQQETKVAADRAWREQVKAERPVLGRLQAAVVPKVQIQREPAHVRSWGQGAPGEKRVGEVLDGIAGVVALHDRKVPRSRANIDHIAVTPAGVWVIDTKRYVDKAVECRDVGGWFRTDERLYVGGRDQTKLVDAMTWQVEVVAKVVRESNAEVEIKPMVCFVGSTWGWFAKPFLVRGVAVAWPVALPDLMTRRGPLDRQSLEVLARTLASNLKPA